MTDLSLALLAALGAGLICTVIRLPPLVGFLAAGFALNAAGVSELDGLDTVADLGVALLLFGIGLKLDIRILGRREVWLTSVAHLTAASALGWAFLGAIALVAAGLLPDQDWRSLLVVGFALSFSSTVLVVKALEEDGSTRSRFAITSLGILIIQDIAAVIFLTSAKGSPPSPWALLLVLLVPAAFVVRPLLARLDHGELLPLFGLALALGPGYALFEAVGLKGDLGALVIGLLLAPEARSAELAKALFSVKELLLVGFFLSIGFTGLPSAADLALAALLVALVPVKSWGFAMLLRLQGMRHRTSIKAGTVLGNYSEFALIVAAVGAGSDLIDEQWLVILATSVAFSFLGSAALNRRAESLVALAERRWPTQDPQRLHPDDRPIDVARADAVVLGMGRVGRATYHQLTTEYGLDVIGIDSGEERAAELCAQGMDVIVGDAMDPDLFRLLTRTDEIDLAVLAMPSHGANHSAIRHLETSGFGGIVVAVAQYDDEADEMRTHVDAVLGLYDGTGTALADSAAELAGFPRR
jgi:glutathione-regulated potassium-efflux system ancillary protein KefC